MQTALSMSIKVVVAHLTIAVLSAGTLVIKNSPTRGKRETLTPECPRCLNGAGRCVGPFLCCAEGRSCFHGAVFTLECQQEDNNEMPCYVPGHVCGIDNKGTCALPGVCCDSETCTEDEQCGLNTDITDGIDKLTPKKIAHHLID